MNFKNYVTSQEVESALAKGENFAIALSKIPTEERVIHVETSIPSLPPDQAQ